ncbi:MAG: MarR family transcriptional regulator [Desulfobacteraceae bacterium]|nr:MAG: MarR family transcriptional regulator [Desulfobacteraceae bacterium]
MKPIITPNNCPYYLISRISLQVTGVLKKEFAEKGAPDVKPAYLGVLFALWQSDGLKVVELGHEAGLEPSTMTGLLDRMEKSELVYRAADPSDRRVQRIFLTRKGIEVKDITLEVVNHVIDTIFEGISGQELAKTMDLLKQVLTNAQKAGR